MSAPVWIAIGTCLGLTLVTPFVIGLVMFLVPGGRKGSMRTEREVAHQGLSVEQAKELYAGRLAYDGFVISPSAYPNRLEAQKLKAPSTETYSHADKGLSVTIDFAPEAPGVRVLIAMWMNDFVLKDSGEGRLIDLTLDRLVTAQLDREPPPIVPNTSFMVLTSFVSVLMSIVLIVWIWTGVESRSTRMAGVVAGAGAACVMSMLLAHQALAEIRRRPAELTGKGLVAATMIAGAIGIAVAGAALYVRFGEAIAAAARNLVR